MNRKNRAVISIIFAAVFISLFIGAIGNGNTTNIPDLIVNPETSASQNILAVNSTLALDNNTIYNGNVDFPDFFQMSDLMYNPYNTLIYSAGGSNIEIINSSESKVVGHLSISVTSSVRQMIYEPLNHSIFLIDNHYLRIISPENRFVEKYQISTYGKLMSMTYDNVTNLVYILSLNQYGNEACIISFNPLSHSISSVSNFTAVNPSFSNPYIVFDYKDNSLYTSNFDNITVLNLSDKKIQNITTNNTQFFLDLSFDPLNDYIYASNTVNLTVLNTNTEKFIGNISGSNSSVDTAVLFDSFNQYIYSMAGNNIYLTEGMVNVGRSTVGTDPTSLMYINNVTYTLNADNMNITLKQGYSSIGEIFLGAAPSSIIYDNQNRNLYVDNQYAMNVWEINGTSNLISSNINLSIDPQTLLFDQYNKLVYVLGVANGTEYVSTIEGKSVKATIDTGVSSGSTSSMALGGDGILYISTGTSDKITTFSTIQNSVGNISVNGTPTSIAYDPASNELYVAVDNNSACNLTVMKSNEVIATIEFKEINDMIYVPYNHEMYVSNNTAIYIITSNFKVLMVNGTSSNGSFPELYYNMVFDGENNYIYAAGSGYNAIQGIGYVSSINVSSNSVSSKIYVGMFAVLTSLSFNNITGNVYESHFDTGRVSIISGYAPNIDVGVSTSAGKYTATFTESGLPAGTSWSISFNGTNKESTSDAISFTANNGTYSFSVGKVSGYTTSLSSGVIIINGKNVSKDINYTTSSSNVPNFELYVVVGVLLLALIIISVFFYFYRLKK